MLQRGGDFIPRSQRARILMALFSTVLVIFYSILTFQSLSAGRQQSGVDIGESPTPTPTPDYTEDIVPNDETSQETTFYITDGQRYFENLVDPQSTNILILGTEPTGFNFDTIMILNIDKQAKKVKIISFPRDIYIDYSDNILDTIAKVKPALLKEKGIFRINAAPSIGDNIAYRKSDGRFKKPYVDFIADLIEEVFAIPIKDYVYVKTKGFREIVDAFGGVKVYVPVRMYYIDPTQDLYIDIEKGTRTLHGKDAEGYVRFRQGYDENGAFHNYGDLFRKQNQNRFIQAFIQQHVTLKNLGKLPTLMDIFKRNVITSVTELGQFTDYAAMAEQAINEGYTIESVELQLTEKTIDGSSYVVIKTDKE